MILAKNQPSVLPFIFVRASTLGVFSLVLFLGFHLYAVVNLAFLERSQVQQTLSFLDNNNLILHIFDLFFVSLPLGLLFARKAFFSPLSASRGLSLLGQLAAALSLVAVIFHLYVAKMIFTESLGLYPYFADAMVLFNTPFGFYAHSAFLVVLTLFLTREIGYFAAEWGIVVRRQTQIVLSRGLTFLGILLVAFEIFIMIYQGQIK